MQLTTSKLVGLQYSVWIDVGVCVDVAVSLLLPRIPINIDNSVFSLNV